MPPKKILRLDSSQRKLPTFFNTTAEQNHDTVSENNETDETDGSCETTGEGASKHSSSGVNKTWTGSDRIGLTKPGLDRTGLTKPGWDCVRLTKPGLDPKKKRMAINYRQNSHVTFWHSRITVFFRSSVKQSCYGSRH